MQERINKCIKESFTSLDLSNLDLFELPILSKDVTNQVKYLFLGNNNLTKIDINCFEKIEVLDVSYNKIKQLSIPYRKYITEINCSNNKLDYLDIASDNKNLVRIDCSYNNMTYVPTHTYVEILVCHNNNIHIISNFPRLKKLICGYNKIELIEYCFNLEEVVCNNNLLSLLPVSEKIIYIDCIKNNIMRLDYICSLKELICDYNYDINMDTRYNISDYLKKMEDGNENMTVIFK